MARLVRHRRRTPDDPDPGPQADAMLPAWVGADMSALNMPNDLETNSPLVLPAAAHLRNAAHLFTSHNLVVGGHTGSGKSILAWFLGITASGAPNGDCKVVVIQHRRSPQRMNADFARRIIPEEWTSDAINGRGLQILDRVRVNGARQTFSATQQLPPRTLMFTTSGLFVNFANHHAFCPDVVVIDEIHERSWANDWAMHTLMITNLNRVARQEIPIFLIVATATGWKDVATFLRDEYELTQNEFLKFSNVDVRSPIKAVTRLFMEEVPRDLTDYTIAVLWDVPEVVLRAEEATLIVVPGHLHGEAIQRKINKKIRPSLPPGHRRPNEHYDRRGEFIGPADIQRMMTGVEAAPEQQGGRGAALPGGMAAQGRGKGGNDRHHGLDDMRIRNVGGAADNTDPSIARRAEELRDQRQPPEMVHFVQFERKQQLGEHWDTKITAYYIDSTVHPDTLKTWMVKEAGVHKVFVSTNFLESSGTIPGVRNVIDTGHQYLVRYNVEVGCTIHALSPISSRSARQRAGRAAREIGGVVVHLYPSYHYLDTVGFNLMANPDEYVGEVILKMSAMTELGKVPMFKWIDEHARTQQITGLQRGRFVRVQAPSGHSLITVYPAVDVASAICELKYLRCIAEGPPNPNVTDMYLTRKGMAVQETGLTPRWGSMVVAMEINLPRYEAMQVLEVERRHHLPSTHEDYDPNFQNLPESIQVIKDTAKAFRFGIAAMACAFSAGRNPIMSRKVLKDIADRAEKDNDRADNGKRKDENIIERRHETIYRVINGRNHRSITAKMEGVSIPRLVGEHLQRMWIVHALVHEILKNQQIQVPNTLRGRGTITSYITAVNFWQHYQPANDVLLGKWCSSLGLKHNVMFQIIENMQHMARRQGFNWFDAPNLHTFHPNRVRSVSLDIMQHVFLNSTSNIAQWNTNNTFTSTRGALIKIKDVEDDERADHLSNVHMHPENDRQNHVWAEYVIFEECFHSQKSRDMSYEWADVVPDEGRLVSAATGVASRNRHEYNEMRTQWNRALQFATELTTQRRTAMLHSQYNGETRLANINRLPTPSFGVAARDVFSFFHNPLSDPAVRDRAMDRLRVWTRADMETVEEIRDLRPQEWAYVRLGFPMATPEQDKFVMEHAEQYDWDTDRRNRLVDAITDFKRRTDRNGPPSQIISDDCNGTWWWMCVRCRAACRMPAMTVAPRHDCDTTFRYDRQAAGLHDNWFDRSEDGGPGNANNFNGYEPGKMYPDLAGLGRGRYDSLDHSAGFGPGPAGPTATEISAEDQTYVDNREKLIKAAEATAKEICRMRPSASLYPGMVSTINVLSPDVMMEMAYAFLKNVPQMMGVLAVECHKDKMFENNNVNAVGEPLLETSWAAKAKVEKMKLILHTRNPEWMTILDMITNWLLLVPRMSTRDVWLMLAELSTTVHYVRRSVYAQLLVKIAEMEIPFLVQKYGQGSKEKAALAVGKQISNAREKRLCHAAFVLSPETINYECSFDGTTWCADVNADIDTAESGIVACEKMLNSRNVVNMLLCQTNQAINDRFPPKVKDVTDAGVPTAAKPETMSDQFTRQDESSATMTEPKRLTITERAVNCNKVQDSEEEYMVAETLRYGERFPSWILNYELVVDAFEMLRNQHDLKVIMVRPHHHLAIRVTNYIVDYKKWTNNLDTLHYADQRVQMHVLDNYGLGFGFALVHEELLHRVVVALWSMMGNDRGKTAKGFLVVDQNHEAEIIRRLEHMHKSTPNVAIGDNVAHRIENRPKRKASELGGKVKDISTRSCIIAEHTLFCMVRQDGPWCEPTPDDRFTMATRTNHKAGGRTKGLADDNDSDSQCSYFAFHFPQCVCGRSVHYQYDMINECTRFAGKFPSPIGIRALTYYQPFAMQNGSRKIRKLTNRVTDDTTGKQEELCAIQRRYREALEMMKDEKLAGQEIASCNSDTSGGRDEGYPDTEVPEASPAGAVLLGKINGQPECLVDDVYVPAAKKKATSETMRTAAGNAVSKEIKKSIRDSTRGMVQRVDGRSSARQVGHSSARDNRQPVSISPSPPIMLEDTIGTAGFGTPSPAQFAFSAMAREKQEAALKDMINAGDAFEDDPDLEVIGPPPPRVEAPTKLNTHAICESMTASAIMVDEIHQWGCQGGALCRCGTGNASTW